MEEKKKAYGLVMVFVRVFVFLFGQHYVVQPVAGQAGAAFMTTNRAQGIQCDTVSPGRVGDQGQGAGGPSDKSSASITAALSL